MLSQNIMGPDECIASTGIDYVAGTDVETILRNYEISPVSTKPTVPFWVAQPFALNKIQNFVYNL
jgi:hypothetical protein